MPFTVNQADYLNRRSCHMFSFRLLILVVVIAVAQGVRTVEVVCKE